jgi:hypothetical protein
MSLASRDGLDGPKPRSLINGLGKATASPLSRRNLTEAEREVALLLLKELSLFNAL